MEVHIPILISPCIKQKKNSAYGFILEQDKCIEDEILEKILLQEEFKGIFSYS